MKKGKLLRILTVFTLLVMLAVAIPAIPVQAAATLMISPASGPPGQRVDIMATGFTGLTTSALVSQTVSVYLGSEEFQFPYDYVNNRITGYFIVPLTMLPGTYDLVLKACPPGGSPDPCSIMILQNSVTFTVTTGTIATVYSASITLNPTKGIPGTPVTISGTNFTPGASVRLYFNNVDTGLSRTVADNGTVSIPFSPNLTDPGTYVVRLEDNSDAHKSGQADFQVIAELRAFIGKNNGAIGTNQTAAGTGFKPNTPITIKYDNTEITGAKANTDAAGAFTTTFKIPASTGGEHTITVTDGTNTKTFKFIMETTPPNIPVLLTPVSNTVIDGPVFLDWQDITDDSMPVTYNLQLSPDPAFTASAVTLDKKDLKESRYTLSLAEQDKLTPIATANQPTPKDTRYYWAVQAVDGASNKSDWSTPTAFIVPAPKSTATTPASTSTPTTTAAPKPGTGTGTGTGTGLNLPGNLPSWAIYVLVGLIALLFLFIGIMLGRRSAY